MANVNVINSEAAGHTVNGVLVSVATREQISRWMDGDIAPHEVELAMSTLTRDDNRYCWAEMHFVGDCIRGLEPTANGCAERIRAAIAAEPTIVAPQVKTARERAALQERSLFASMRQMGRGGRAWATAAAVAAVGFVGTVVYQDQIRALQVTANNAGTLSSPVGANASVAVNEPRNADFNALLQAHQESADATSMSAVRQYLRPAVVVQGQ
jgi:negative regulator of sigma E activity